jgi:ATP-dependent helicase HrpB
MKPEDLPVNEIRTEFCRAFWEESARIVLRAPTGSGKSTQIPKWILHETERDSREILVLQPRRMAARMLSARVAQEIGEPVGKRVGYQIRMDRVACTETRILFVTEGILLRRILEDPCLKSVCAVIFDEFHERHLYGDIGLARCLLLQQTLRPDLKLVVMSATLDGADLVRYLGNARLIESEGRMHPVEIEYLPRSTREEPVWETATRVVAMELPKTPGNVLVFMPGAHEIARTVSALRSVLPKSVPVVPLHGELPPAEQDAAVAAGGPRKVIVATNVAETSLTIEGVTLVVDSGLARIARFDPRRSIDMLHIERISRASADQRAGRAGRTMPGRCIRLWTVHEDASRPLRTEPEILRVDLTEAILALKAGGIDDLAAFPWVTPPPPAALERALTLLRDLGALDEAHALTPLGQRLLAFPAHPRYARMFLAAAERGCGRAAALIAAIAQGRELLMRCNRKIEEERNEILGGGNSDFSMLFRAMAFARKNRFCVDACSRLGIHAGAAREADRLFERFLELAECAGIPVGERPITDDDLAACVLAGFPDQVGRRVSRGAHLYDLVHGRRAVLSAQSLAAGAEFLVSAEIREIGQVDGKAEIRLGLATAISAELLCKIFPENIQERREVIFDSIFKRVVVRKEVVYRDLMLEKSDRDADPGPEAAECLAAQILSSGRLEEIWDDACRDYIARVNFLAKAMPELGIPPIDSAALALLLSQFCEGATCLRDLRDRQALPVLKSWLRPDQQAQVERLAPARITLPSGTSAKVAYLPDGTVKVSARIQDFYGLDQITGIAGGRVSPRIEVLAPNFRPVQITDSLTNFWQTTYPEIAPALKRKYPKHVWKTPEEVLALLGQGKKARQ